MLIITGKGLMKEDGGVLRQQVPRWLNQPPNRGRVLAFAGDTTYRWRTLGLPESHEGVEAHARFCRAMLDRGVYPPPSQFEAWFPSLAHTDGDVERTVEAARTAFAELAS